MTAVRYWMFGALGAVCGFAAVAHAESAYPIAGLTPNQRPAGAPTITEFVKPADWDARFFYGVAKPIPESLSWSRDQGAWFTPFNHPGLDGPYDIRGWYKTKG